METKPDRNEFVDPNLGRMVAAQEIRNCRGCAYEETNCPTVENDAPMCVGFYRKDGRDIIWVRADDSTQAPKAVKLTGEQINEIEVASWSGLGFGAKFNRESFARAIEAEVLKANGLGDQQ